MDSYGFNKGELWQEISRRKQRAKIFIPLSPFLRGCPTWLSPSREVPILYSSCPFWVLVNPFYSSPFGLRMVIS